MKTPSLNKIFLPLFTLNIVVLTTLFYFYYRDVVAASSSEAEGCAPHAVNIDSLGKNSAQLSWKTDSLCSSHLKIGLYSDSIDQTVVGDNGYAAAREHTAQLENLRPDTVYYITFFSNGETYGDRGKPFELKTESF